MHFRTVLWLICALLFAPAIIIPSQQDTVFRVNVDLVQVDAVVTDSEGRPVTDLRADEFIVLQDGKPQEITHFSFVRTKNPSAPLPPKARTGEKVFSTPAPPPVPLQRDRVRRTIALVVDDLGLSHDTMVRVRESVKRWVDEQMQPDDLVALVMTGGGVGLLQQLTNDKRLLYSGVDGIHINAASRIGVSSFKPTSGQPAKNNKDAYGIELTNPWEERDLHFTLFSLESIQLVVNGLKNLPGRKSIILFSESLRIMMDAGKGQSQGRDFPLRERLIRLIQSANRSGVVIHAIDPRGVIYTGITAEDNLQDLTTEDMSQIMAQRTTQLNDSKDAMVTMAQQTGGLFVQNRNDIDSALEMVADDGDGYYLIGYRPDETTVSEMKNSKPRLHAIRVRLTRPGLRVRSRSEFFSTPDSSQEPDPFARRERIEQALQSPFTAGSLRIRLTALFSQTGKGTSCITALLHFDASQLTFSDDIDGWHRASFEVVAGLFTADGKQVELADKAWNFSVTGQTYQKMRKKGIAFLVNVPVKKPGTYQMRLVLRDPKTGQLGSALQIVEVPDTSGGKLALSGIVLAADQRQPASAFSQIEGPIEDEDSNRTAAVRIFEPDMKLAWAYQILNAKTGSDRRPQLQVQLRLFHEGQEIYARKTAMTPEAMEYSSRIISTGQMQLRKLPPGYYVLQVAVTDTLADEKHQLAAQSMDFEVRNGSTGIGPAEVIFLQRDEPDKGLTNDP